MNSPYAADLELARQCAAGDEQAWERFILEYRPVLYRAADAIDPSGGARELADSLYADLYGLRTNDSERKSLFLYFQGRSSLATWLRAVLTQRFVDRIRAPWGFTGILVKFKLEVGISEQELVEVAEASRRQSSADLMVANTLDGMAEWAYLGAGDYRRVPRPELAEAIVEAVEKLSEPVA